ncbi:AraC family transcriptional regulator [bacterium]|nr:AraC family transcriptional regulator [bacterium]
MTSTIISTWIPVVLRACESSGYDSAGLLQEAGIDPLLIKDIESRISIAAYNRLWQLAVERTGDPCLGLKVVTFLKPTTFHALGIALMASDSIGDALNRLQRNYPLISDEVRLTIFNKDDLTALCFSPEEGGTPPADASVDAFMAVSLSYARTLDDERLNPVQVEFMHAKPHNPAPYQDFFRAPLHFSARDNRIYFNRMQLERPLPFANTEIALRNEEIVLKYLSRLRKVGISEQVRQQIKELLITEEPAIEVVARTLGVSIRSLNRYLRHEKASYRMLLDDVRRDLSLEYLKQENLSVLETAFKLGYADSSNFSRAFKRWYGIAPSLYKKRSPSAIEH